MPPVVSKSKDMPATTTRLINRIWGEYYSNHFAADAVKEKDNHAPKKGDEIELEDSGEENFRDILKDKCGSFSKLKKAHLSSPQTKWEGEVLGKTFSGNPLYKRVIVRGDMVAVGGAVLNEIEDSDICQSIYFVEYMFEKSDGSKWIHGRQMLRACQTVLGSAGNEREVFLTTNCMDLQIEYITKPVIVQICKEIRWGHQHRKSDANRLDRSRSKDSKSKDLPLEYFCKALYSPERGAFFCLSTESLLGLGTGICHSCKRKDFEKGDKLFKLDTSTKSFRYQGTTYRVNEYVYIAPRYFEVDRRGVKPRAYVVCQFLEIMAQKPSKRDTPKNVKIKVQRFFRPEDVSSEKAHSSDIREVYYSDQLVMVPIVAIQGKCEIRRRRDFLFSDGAYVFEHIFFCERIYDPESGALKQLPPRIKLTASKENLSSYAKRKGKSIKGEASSRCIAKQQDAAPMKRLDTLDIFAGCGGLSEGLEQSGASITKWAIEYDEAAGKAFKLNHPTAVTIINNCNVILRAIMNACGDEEDCISSAEAAELAAKLDKKELENLPRPGQVDFINGGPPCQGFSWLNRFEKSTWSKVKCEMILSFLSFADYFRPKYFLLENVRNFILFDKGQTFHLTLASLLEMGYQVKFGILEAGAYGVSQSRNRAFIWAASPEEILPEWPEPMHVFSGREFKIPLTKGLRFHAVRSTKSGAPFRAITVRDTIGDLPAVGNGASKTIMKYKHEPVSWFQEIIREDSLVLTDHISKQMKELNYIRCQRIPKRPGADWRDLPDEKVKLSNGETDDLVAEYLRNSVKKNNHWKGVLGRLDWEGNFPTTITNPEPMGKVGKCFHPDQDRILTVRECARSQGFFDSYKFVGDIGDKHRQVGNAVPPPLAFALGRKLKEAMESNISTK